MCAGNAIATVVHSQLVFKAEQQSLRGPDAALVTPYIDSGTAMVWSDDAITKDLGIDTGLGDFTAEFHAKLKFGLVACAQLGGLGWYASALIGVNDFSQI